MLKIKAQEEFLKASRLHIKRVKQPQNTGEIKWQILPFGDPFIFLNSFINLLCIRQILHEHLLSSAEN